MREQDERDERDELPELLARAARGLRDVPEPTPRAEWRDALLRTAASLASERDGVRRSMWTVRPIVAIAACVACVAVGAALSYGVLRGGTGAGTELAAGGEAPPSASSVRHQPRGLPVRFAVVAPGAARVSIVGDFNEWNPAGLPMHRMPDGRTWEVEVGLTPGRYAYAFVVDGRLARDPSAAEAGGDDFGVPNSVVLVHGS